MAFAFGERVFELQDSLAEERAIRWFLAQQSDWTGARSSAFEVNDNSTYN